MVIAASRTDSFHVSSPGGEQAVDGSVAQLWRDRRGVRDHSDWKSSSAFGTNERNRGPHVGGDGRVLFSETQRWHGRVARRRSGGFAGTRSGARGRDRW